MIDGLVVVDKPSGITSHDVVSRLRRACKQKRIGHAGTLDPSATGILLVALGRATRLMQYVSELPKSYVGELVLGATTSSLDADGDVTNTYEMSDVSLQDVQLVSEKFVGKIEQIPPMVSAIKVKGKRLHQLAREGVEVERAPRPVEIFELQVEPTTDPMVFRLYVKCSSGTYIRSLAADIGTALGGGAHLRNLRRCAIGDFDESQATPLAELENNWKDCVLPSVSMVKHFPRIMATDSIVDDVKHGRPIKITPDVQSNRFAIVDANQDLLALYELVRPGVLKASVVLSAE